MIDASFELQKAAYAHLRGDAAIRAILGDPARIYDDPPAGAAFPYLTIGETRLRAVAGLDHAFEHELRFNAWSTYAGRREVKAILSALYDSLHDEPLSIAGHHLISLRYVFSDVFARSDGETFQGVARFRAVTQMMEIA